MKDTAYYFKALDDYRCGGYTMYIYPPIGEWTPPVIGPLIPCAWGYHVARPQDLFRWLHRTHNVYLVEAISQDKYECMDKVVVRSLRLVRKLDLDSNILEKLFAYMGWTFYYQVSLYDFRTKMFCGYEHTRKKAMAFLMNHWGIKPLWLD